MATPISSSRPSRTVLTGASAAIGWAARAGRLVGSGPRGLRAGVGPGVLLRGPAGGGAMQSTPASPTGAGGLMPNVEDKDAGLVAAPRGFNTSRYKVIVVEPSPVTAPTSKDEGDRQFA